MRKIRKGDKVQVISGKDKGRSGKVLQVIARIDKNGKEVLLVLVENINLKTHYQKANPQRQVAAALLKKEAPLYACKVALIDPVKDKPCRIGIRVVDGEKVRVSKISGEVING
jgi:large subunit ribosomal protein L24